jgi:pimeloyl-ACP methyl ester carboxylesterase
VLTPDLLGYGKSVAPPGARPDMATQAVHLLRLLDALDIAKAVVIAHDVGSAAAQIMVATARERVRGLVVLDGVYADSWAMEGIKPIQSLDPAQASRLFRLMVRQVRSGGSISDERAREVLAPYEGEEGGKLLIRAAQALDPRQTAELLDALRASGVPALVLWGERDRYLPVESVGQPLARLLGAELRLLPGGHFVPLDCPAEVASALLGFLASLG